MDNPIQKILLENATTFSERNQIFALTEADSAVINNTMIANLYKSAIDKSHVDFDNIPDSKGDITKYTGYVPMMKTISLLKEIAVKSNIKIPELATVEQAISNITVYKDLFEKGFRLEKEFIILQYNVLVAACVESISTIISSYVDYVKRVDKVEFTVIKGSKLSGWLCISNLERFNISVKNGDFAKVLNTVINSGKQGFVGVDDIIIPALIIGGVMILVPLIRELIFYFFYARMKISDYLKQQAAFLELNRINVEVSNLPANKKKEILKKQSETINTLNSLSDKIKVNHTMAQSKAVEALKTENKNWTFDSVQSQAASSDQTGFKLL